METDAGMDRRDDDGEGGWGDKEKGWGVKRKGRGDNEEG